MNESEQLSLCERVAELVYGAEVRDDTRSQSPLIGVRGVDAVLLLRTKPNGAIPEISINPRHPEAVEDVTERMRERWALIAKDDGPVFYWRLSDNGLEEGWLVEVESFKLPPNQERREIRVSHTSKGVAVFQAAVQWCEQQRQSQRRLCGGDVVKMEGAESVA